MPPFQRQLTRFILFFCFGILFRFHSTSRFINESDIFNQCRSVVKALPIYNAYTESHNEFRKSLCHDDCNESDFEAQRYGLCIFRYYQLLNQGHEDRDLIQKRHRPQREWKSGCSSIKSQKRLFILDLDGTILDQQVMHRSPIYMEDPLLVDTLYDQIAHDHNAKTLKLGLQNHHSPDCLQFDTIVYRPYLFEFIDQYRGDSEFVIYSFADPQDVIPHVIQLEMHYNLVYRLQLLRDRNQNRDSNPDSYSNCNSNHKEGDFKFLRVITTVTQSSNNYHDKDEDEEEDETEIFPEDKYGPSTVTVNATKSLSIIGLLVNLDCFDTVYIIDSTPNSWIVSANHPRIFSHDAPEFRVEAYDPKWNTFVKHVLRVQQGDIYMQSLMRFVDIEDRLGNKTLSWIDIVEMHRLLRMYGREGSPLYPKRDFERFEFDELPVKKTKNPLRKKLHFKNCCSEKCIVS